MKDLAGAAIDREQYESLQKLCMHGAALPSTFDEWNELITCAETEANSLGLPTSPIAIDVREFENWTHGVGVHPCLEALCAFMIIKRHGRSSLP